MSDYDVVKCLFLFAYDSKYSLENKSYIFSFLYQVFPIKPCQYYWNFSTLVTVHYNVLLNCSIASMAMVTTDLEPKLTKT